MMRTHSSLNHMPHPYASDEVAGGEAHRLFRGRGVLFRVSLLVEGGRIEGGQSQQMITGRKQDVHSGTKT